MAFAFSPFITRIYGPEVFGLQGLFLSLVSILAPIVALRYPMAIIVAEDETDARHLGQLSMLVSFVLSCLLGVLLLVAGEPIQAVLGAEALGPLIWFLPLAVFCVAAQDVTGFRAVRDSQFRLVGIVNVIQAFLTNLARVLGGLVTPVAGVLVAVTSLTPAVQAALLHVTRKRGRSPVPPLRRLNAFALLRKHRDFPIYRVPTDVMNSASQSVPVIMLAALFSPTAAGLYVLTRSVLTLPATLIGTAIGNVLYAHYADLNRAQKPLMPVLIGWTTGLLAFAPFIIGLAWFAPGTFAFVFGEEWREAGAYAQWMSLWIAISIANVPAVRIAPVIESQMLLLFVNGAMLGSRALAMFATFWLGGTAIEAVAVFSLVSLIGNVALIGAIMIVARRHDAAVTSNVET